MKYALLRGWKSILSAFIIIIFVKPAFSQSPWKDVSERDITVTGKRHTFPKKFRLLALNTNEMKTHLSSVPMERAATSDLTHASEISLPMPDGGFQRFKVVKYFVMHPDLSARYPDISTYTGQGIDDPYATIKLDLTPRGFHAMILTPGGSIFIDPYQENNTENYISYYKTDLEPSGTFSCSVQGDENLEKISAATTFFQRSSGTQLRTYRLALACTGEYAATKGGTVSGALAGMVTTMNRVNGVFESEVDVRMVMIANNNLICYTNSSTDPYTNSNGNTMLGQNISNLNTVIGSSNFDVGHVFSTGGGGVAYLNGPCGSNKAGGVTGSSNPLGDPFDIDYVAHEMGHQFGANHTFNSTSGSCNGNRASSAAYEPGSGVTIMGYAGICGTNDLAPNSIAYFHSKSFDEITIFTQSGNGNNCASVSSTGNTPPVVNSMGVNVAIPISTPFMLTGSATDANNDPLSYSWEQYDLGPSGNWNVQSATAPMFRSFAPSSSPSRTFPKLSDIINNTTTIGELLPNDDRTLNFRLTARDNRSGGAGVMHPDNTLAITVVDNGGAFAVTAPNTAVSWAGNSTQTVTWNVSGTTNSPINTSNVKISLSTNGGNTFPIVLLENTPNDGSELVTVPNINTSQARVKVEAVGNIYFDMSNANFTINATTSLTTITTGTVSPSAVCAGASISVPFTSDAAANAGNVFTVQLSNASGSFAVPVNIGTLTSTTASTINGIIPAGTLAGNGYRVRVVSSSPAVTGTINTSNITINTIPAAPVITANGPVTFCTGGSVLLSGNNGGVWNTGASSPTLTVTASGNYFVTNTNSCGTVSSNQIIVTVNQNPVADAGSYAATTTAGPAITLSGTPAGGSFSGPGVAGNTFNPAAAGVGTHTIIYSYTNASGCSDTDGAQMVVNAASCNFFQGTISGPANACEFMNPEGGNASYSINSTGYSSITWFVPANAMIVSGQGTQNIVVDFQPGYTNGYVVAKVLNPCDGKLVSVILNVRNTAPATPGSITGSNNSCLFIGTGQTGLYRIKKVANAGFYQWTVPTGVSIVGHPAGTGVNDTIVELAFNNNFVLGSSISVRAGSFCGISASRSLAISGINPATPGAISGPAEVCSYVGNGFAVYTVRKVASASSFNWTVPAGANIVARPGGINTPNDTIVHVAFTNAFNTGNISARSVNGCGISTARTLPLKKILPTVPSKIYGDPNGAQGALTTAPLDACPFIFTGTNARYSILKDPYGYAESYNWVLSDNVNAQIVAHPGGTGANDTLVEVHFNDAFTSATLSVTPVRPCGVGPSRMITITKKAPATPGIITGNSSPCPFDMETYTVTGQNAEVFNWTVPSTVTVLWGNGTDMLTVMFNGNFAGGQIRVQSVSACGTSAVRALSLTKCANPGERSWVNEVEKDAGEIVIFPNPSIGNVTLLLPQKFADAKEISITDRFGRKVMSQKLRSTSGKLVLNMEGRLSPGLYLITAYARGGRITGKMIVE